MRTDDLRLLSCCLISSFVFELDTVSSFFPWYGTYALIGTGKTASRNDGDGLLCLIILYVLNSI